MKLSDIFLDGFRSLDIGQDENKDVYQSSENMSDILKIFDVNSVCLILVMNYLSESQ